MPEAITPLVYASLAELYQHYVRVYVQASPIIAACGCRIHCYEHHFVHMVKLSVSGQDRLFFPEEKPKILAMAEGFGNYEHEERRARRLLTSLEVLRNPDMVVRTPHLKTGDRAFIKEFADSQYPYIVVVVHKDEGRLVLTTAQPTRRRNLKEWLKGEKLFPKTPQPPVEVAV